MVKRYCMKCEDYQEFKYNVTIRHSECVECGARFGVSPDNPILIHFLNKSNTNQKQILCPYLSKKLQTIKGQKEHIKNLERQIKKLKGGD